MRTLDTNHEAQLALVHDDGRWQDSGDTRYIPLDEAPPLDSEQIPQVYMNQLHYVASHVPVGLVMHDRINEKGEKPPRTGWTRWHP